MDVRVCRIYEGTDEILKLKIAAACWARSTRRSSSRSSLRGIDPSPASFASSLAVQSHSQQAHGSSPFRSRQRDRAWRILDLHQVEELLPVRPLLGQGRVAEADLHPLRPAVVVDRASRMFRTYSSPATDPAPSVPASIGPQQVEPPCPAGRGQSPGSAWPFSDASPLSGPRPAGMFLSVARAAA